MKKSFIQKSKLEFDIEETNYEDWLFYFSLLALNSWNFNFLSFPYYLYDNSLQDSLSRKEEKYQKMNENRPIPDFSDEYYTSFFNLIRSSYIGLKPLKFHIYSIGDISVFDYLKNDDVEFHINTDMLDTFTGFIFADILLISHSCLSYTAAFFCNGIVFYKYWNHLHLGLKSWRLFG